MKRSRNKIVGGSGKSDDEILTGHKEVQIKEMHICQ